MTLNNSGFWLPIAIALLTLVPLAWLAWRGSGLRDGSSRLALGARILGILLLLFSLADPQRVAERPAKGENVVALLADNSRGMRIQDVGAFTTRGDSLRESLTGERSAWIQPLEELFQLRNYSFDERLQRVATYQSLDFSGERSDLATALTDLAGRLDRLPLAGIALFTDGNATDAQALPADLSSLPPVFPILIGDARPVPDLSIADISLTQSAFDDAPFNLRATIAAQGLGDSTVEVSVTQLHQNERLSEVRPSDTRSQRLQLSERRPEATARFEWTPASSGVLFYEVSTKQAGGAEEMTAEATLENNRRTIAIDRGAEKYRILYVAGRPNWEYKFLNRALAEDPQIELVALLRVAAREPKFEFKGRQGESGNPLYRGFGREDDLERYDESVLVRLNTRDEEELKAGFPSDAETLFAYDAIVIDDLEADFFTFSQQTLLREFVKQRGGGLLMLGGANSLNDGGYDRTPLAHALPVYLDTAESSAVLDRSVAWDLTREGWVEAWTRIRANESDERQRLQSMPAFLVSHDLARVKPGATVLATVESALGSTLPALAIQNFGSGRAATVAVGDFWRWGLQSQAANADLARFWRQIARWLVKDNPRRVELVANPGPAGVELVATARDAAYRPLQLGSARVAVERVGGDESKGDGFSSLDLPMKPVPNAPGQFALELPLAAAGAYLAKVEVLEPEGGQIGTAEVGWVAQPLVEEFASITPNQALLERLAQETGGQLLRLDELGQLAEALVARPAPVTETWSDPIWHKNWFFLLALSCFLIEWLIRRRKGLA